MTLSSTDTTLLIHGRSTQMVQEGSLPVEEEPVVEEGARMQCYDALREWGMMKG